MLFEEKRSPLSRALSFLRSRTGALCLLAIAFVAAILVALFIVSPALSSNTSGQENGAAANSGTVEKDEGEPGTLVLSYESEVDGLESVAASISGTTEGNRNHTEQVIVTDGKAEVELYPGVYDVVYLGGFASDGTFVAEEEAQDHIVTMDEADEREVSVILSAVDDGLREAKAKSALRAEEE